MCQIWLQIPFIPLSNREGGGRGVYGRDKGNFRIYKFFSKYKDILTGIQENADSFWNVKHLTFALQEPVIQVLYMMADSIEQVYTHCVTVH